VNEKRQPVAAVFAAASMPLTLDKTCFCLTADAARREVRSLPPYRGHGACRRSEENNSAAIVCW
jgi:hypothetical protein